MISVLEEIKRESDLVVKLTKFIRKVPPVQARRVLKQVLAAMPDKPGQKKS